MKITSSDCNKKLYILKPPIDDWPQIVFNNVLHSFRFITNAVSISTPIKNSQSTQILWFHNTGDYRSHPFCNMYDGTVLDSIPSDWYEDINEGRIHIIINTSEESWGPVYEGKINHVESVDVHLNLANAANRLGLNPKCITWITGDLNAEAHCVDSEINVKSVCWFKHSFVRMIADETDSHITKFKNKNKNPSNWMIFLNRWPKVHRSYVSARFWQLGKDEQYWKINDMLWSLPKDLHGKNVCNAYCDLKYKKDTYDDTFDKKNLIDWGKFRDSSLDLYYHLPFKVDNINKDTNDCASIDAVDSIQELYQSSKFSLISETWAEGGKAFISEAIFMAIAFGVPFIVLANAGVLNKLKEFGFKTYDTIFDESYDLIEDDIERWEAVISEVARISRLSDDDHVDMRDSVNNIVDFNYNKMYEIADLAELEFYNWLNTL